jgi:hypothetical protein
MLFDIDYFRVHVPLDVFLTIGDVDWAVSNKQRWVKHDSPEGKALRGWTVALSSPFYVYFHHSHQERFFAFFSRERESLFYMHANAILHGQQRKISTKSFVKLARWCGIEKVLMVGVGMKATLDSYPWLWDALAKDGGYGVLDIGCNVRGGGVAIFKVPTTQKPGVTIDVSPSLQALVHDDVEEPRALVQCGGSVRLQYEDHAYAINAKAYGKVVHYTKNIDIGTPLQQLRQTVGTYKTKYKKLQAIMEMLSADCDNNTMFMFDGFSGYRFEARMKIKSRDEAEGKARAMYNNFKKEVKIQWVPYQDHIRSILNIWHKLKPMIEKKSHKTASKPAGAQLRSQVAFVLQEMGLMTWQILEAIRYIRMNPATCRWSFEADRSAVELPKGLAAALAAEEEEEATAADENNMVIHGGHDEEETKDDQDTMLFEAILRDVVISRNHSAWQCKNKFGRFALTSRISRHDLVNQIIKSYGDEYAEHLMIRD